MIYNITLYGSPASQKQAILLLENLPQIRRIDAVNASGALRLMTDSVIGEKSLIPLFAESGISGFRLE